MCFPSLSLCSARSSSSLASAATPHPIHVTPFDGGPGLDATIRAFRRRLSLLGRTTFPSFKPLNGTCHDGSVRAICTIPVQYEGMFVRFRYVMEGDSGEPRTKAGCYYVEAPFFLVGQTKHLPSPSKGWDQSSVDGDAMENFCG